jgi:hypothetical protein
MNEIDHWSDSDCILPHQRRLGSSSLGARASEKNLYFAQILQLLSDLRSSRKSIAESAFSWLTAKDDVSLFSFNICCESLGMNPDYLRKGILDALSSGRLNNLSMRNGLNGTGSLQFYEDESAT